MDVNDCKARDSLINNLTLTATITRQSDVNLKNVHKKEVTILVQLRFPPGSSKELYIQVTEENDPLVLLTAAVTDSEYQSLCSSQGLLIDFSAFPHHLESHIKHCCSKLSNDEPKEVLVLRVNSDCSPPELSKINPQDKAFLEVVQVGTVRHFSLFSIALTPASEDAKLRYISSTLINLKSSLSKEIIEARDKENNLSSEVTNLRDTLAKKKCDIATLRDEAEQLKLLLTSKEEEFEKKEPELKDKFRSEYDRKLKHALCEAGKKHENQMRKLQSDINDLKKTNLSLSKNNKSQEASLKNIKKENGQYRIKIGQQNDQLDELENVLKQKNDYINEVENRFKDLKRAYEDGCKQLEQMERNYSELKLNRDRLESVLEEKEDQYVELKKEFNKGLKIIKNFKENNEKLMTEKHEHEKDILHYVNSLADQNLKIKSLQEACNRLNKNFEEEKELRISYEEQLSEARKKNTEQAQTIKVIEERKVMTQHLEDMQIEEALLRRAPLMENYLRPHHQTVKQLPGNHALTTSTPLSRDPTPNLNVAAIKDQALARGDPKLLPSNISRISEEGGHQNENIDGNLDNKYLQATKLGLMRKNAAPPNRPLPAQRGKNPARVMRTSSAPPYSTGFGMHPKPPRGTGQTIQRGAKTKPSFK